MIELNIGLDGVPNSKRLQIGNKYENNDEIIKFILPIEFENYKKYVIAVIKKNNEKVTKVFPITDNQFFVSTDITYISGSWSIYLMCRENEIDLEAEEVDISANNGEHVFISDGFIGVVSDSDIDKELVDNIPMDTNLHIVYEDLLKIKQELIDKINTPTSYNDLVDVPTKVSQFYNDKKYQTEEEVTALELKITEEINTRESAITELKEDLVDLVGQIYVDTTIPTLGATVDGVALTANGNSTSNSNAVIKKYKVTAGEKLHLKLSDDTYGVYQFSSDSAVSSKYRVGSTITTYVDEFVAVPTGATYLFVSQLKANTTNTVCYYDSVISLLHDDINIVNGLINGDKINLYGLAPFSICGTNGITGENTTDLYRVSSTEYISFDYDVDFSVDDGYVFAIVVKNGTSILDSGWVTSYTVPKNNQFKISIRKNPEERVNNNLVQYVKAVSFDSKLEHRISSLEIGEVYTPWENEIHRGIVSNTIIENTIPSLIETAKNGFKRLECDVRKTSDDVIVMCHDDTITGTVNGIETTYTIAEVDYSTLSQLVLSTDEIYGEIHVPSFSEYLDKAYFYGLTINVDIKYNIVPLTDVASMVVSKGMSGRVFYNTNSSASSTFDTVLSIDKRARFITFYNANYIQEYAEKYDLNKIVIAVASANVTNEIANTIRNSGFVFMIYDVYNSSSFDYRPDVVEFSTISPSKIKSLIRDYMQNNY